MGIRDRVQAYRAGRELVAQRVAIGIHTATDGRDILINDPDGWEIDRPALWWLGPAGSDGTGGPWGNPPPGAEGGWGNLPSVNRCTSIICDTLGGLPWDVFAGFAKQPKPLWLRDPQLLRTDGRASGISADARLSAVEFWSAWVQSALWWGDGYVYVPLREGEDGTERARDRSKALGAPKPPLWQLNPSDVVIDGSRGELRYYLESTGDEFRYGDLIHLRGMGPYADGHGRGVLSQNGLALGLAMDVMTYAAGTFGTGIPSGYLKVTAPNPTQPQVDDLKRKWMAQHGTSRRSIAVLNATTEFHPISISPVDAQLDMARMWSLRDVALAFGLPAYMLGVPADTSTYANIESRLTELREFTLLPWARRIEATLDAQLPGTQSVKLNLDATLRADPSTRYTAYGQALTDGWMTVDEVRALEDMPPMGSVTP